MASSSSAYDDLRASIADDGVDARVEVNQRALIDKILARYASAGAVYRELLQNSNDAEATIAEIVIVTSNNNDTSSHASLSKSTSSVSMSSSIRANGGIGGALPRTPLVTQVTYRNDGLPFRPQDWSRLRKIAEGNPDETKVGAFGVGAYTMFSVCEEPVVVSGMRGEEECMAFLWRGDSLWTRTGKRQQASSSSSPGIVADVDGGHILDDDRNWTSFIMPSRDPYPLPDMVEFGQFLSASLTFTSCLKNIRVYVDRTLVLDVRKTILESHAIVPPRASSWWKNDGAVTSSSTGMFALLGGSRSDNLTSTSVRLTVMLRKGHTPDCQIETSTVLARYASGRVKTAIPSNVESRMVRVTKKKPPRELTVQVLLDAVDDDDDNDDGGKRTTVRSRWRKTTDENRSGAALITDSFAPFPGLGRVFIGFRTSQTTGLGIHLAAPLLPTVEREAIDFVDAALREYNCELLEICGILMRLVLENAMGRIGTAWEAGRDARDRWEAECEELANEEGVAAPGESKSTNTTISSSLFGFASLMARGVRNTVTEAIKPVQKILGEDDETSELLSPTDDRPLSLEERDAILLMKSFSPRPSTPDSLVGECLARGLGRCLPSSAPPVLTIGGVMRGSEAKLPNLGMEAFGFSNIVRRIMLENAKEYHTLVANVPRLTIDDLIRLLKSKVLEEKLCIRLLKWWPKACRIERSMERCGLQLKEATRYELAKDDDAPSSTAKADDVQLAHVCRLDSILYFTPTYLLELPLPETTFPPSLQKAIGLRTLENDVFRDWFAPLPLDIWCCFISQHPCLVKGIPEGINIQVLAALGKHFDSLNGSVAKRRFVELLSLDNVVIPFDFDDGTPDSSEYQTAIPTELYLPNSDLSAFAGVGVFRKVSKKLTSAGVSDAFLLAMGVRNSISIEFLFLHLDTLRWNTNPKPLIKYLLDADLSPADLSKLRSTQYLPAENDPTRVYAPSELFFKDADLAIFPFIRFLQWPASEGMSKLHRDFLIKLGVMVVPPLQSVMNFMEKQCTNEGRVRDEKVYNAALTFLTQRLGPVGIYEKEYAQWYKSVKFLPCIRQDLETGEVIREIQSPIACYYNPSALIMGFSTLDPQLDTLHVATRTQCNKDPPCSVLIRRLIQITDILKAQMDHFEKYGGNDDVERRKLNNKILSLFDAVFIYLSTRTNDFEKKDILSLDKIAFIPCEIRGKLSFLLPTQIFFKKETSSTETKSEDEHELLTATLFKQIKYNAFLSLVGVKAEPSLQEIFELMLEKPDETLDLLGELQYKAVLQRIASDPPFKQVTKRISSSPFLLGYLVLDEEINGPNEDEAMGNKAQYVLARAEDIHIVDNSFLRRQFPMLVSPMEQTLEEFYNKIGSRYVSEVVKKDFELQGRTYQDTALTRSLAIRLRERRPLLMSPTNSSRPLASDAAMMLDDEHLEIIQVDVILGKYTFEGSSKHLKVTCCCKQPLRGKGILKDSIRTPQMTTLYVTANPDWFDIASAIGALILQRCQLEDSLLLSQLLESPLETLRYRGFPVDRILRPISKPPLEPSPKPVEQATKLSLTTSQPAEATTTVVNDKLPETNASQNGIGEVGFEKILKQMYPHCPSNVIRGLLGTNPTKEKAREVATRLADEFPPPGKITTQKLNATASETDGSTLTSLDDTNPHDAYCKSSRKKKSGLMGKVLRGLHHNAGNGSKRIIQEQPSNSIHTGDSNAPASAERDASTQKSLETMLYQAVQASQSVDCSGVRSPETLLNHLPHGLERGTDGCEVIPAQNIHPYKGPHGNYKSSNGIKVFSTANNNSTIFLNVNFNAVEEFAVVIQRIASVFHLDLKTVAIYFDQNGNTIAFNSNKALYFNLRFFCALHRNKADVAACYSYWYLTFAHELAHNLVTAHNKEHGSFTENIAALYLPDFSKLLSTYLL